MKQIYLDETLIEKLIKHIGALLDLKAQGNKFEFNYTIILITYSFKDYNPT